MGASRRGLARRGTEFPVGVRMMCFVAQCATDFGTGKGSLVLTIHEFQGLTFKSVVILQTKRRKLQINDSVYYDIVAVSRHTETCVYYTDVAGDANGRFIRQAVSASAKDIVDYNPKMALKHGT